MHLVAAEDTRVTRVLLAHVGATPELIRLDKMNEKSQQERLLKNLKQGENIAILSDAGTPGIADPGSLSVQYLLEAGITVIPIPGPCAITTLLSASGLAADQYIFAGFFPKKAGEALKTIESFRNHSCPILWFESPKRILKTLAFLEEQAPDAMCVVGKELTKKFEKIWRGTPKTIHDALSDTLVKGEWCLAVRFPEKAAKTLHQPFLDQAIDLGLSHKAITTLAKTLGWHKNEVYAYLLSKTNNA